MKISLSPKTERLIARMVKSGQYRSADEVVREGLELLEGHKGDALKGSHGKSTAAGNGEFDIAAEFEKIAKDIPDVARNEVPSDLSKNLDSYLYGRRKSS
jgi:putative addiction module CopG family antidote